MIKSWLSRYRPRYIRSLVYMLQESEYDIRDYLKWYHRTRDFVRVERRGHLIWTLKARALYVLAWILVAGAAMIMYAGVQSNSDMVPVVAAVLLVLFPFVLPYAILVPLLILHIAQRPFEYVVLKQTRKQLARHPAVKIAIAGSFGKTSMREILKTVLSQGKKVAAPPHSFNTPLGIWRFVKGLTGEEEVLLFEFGEYYPGDIRTLCRIVQPQWGVITGVNEAHLEKFKSLERTANTIFELADWLGARPLYVNPAPSQRCWVNGESDLARKNARAGDLIYSWQGVGGWRAKDAHSDLTGTSFVLVRGDTMLRLRSGLLGLHQIGPLAAAADIGFRLGLTPGEIERGVAATRPFDHRLQPSTDQSGVVTLDDSYNGNPDGVRAVIEFLRSLRGYRRFYVTPGLVEMGDAAERVHREIGKELAQAHIEKVVLVKNSVTPYLAEGLREAHYDGEIIWFDDALSAFAALPHLTVKGDVVLLQNDWPDQYA